MFGSWRKLADYVDFLGELRLGLEFEREFCGLMLGNVGWW